MVINSVIYKLAVCLTIALCAVETFQYLFSDIPPNPDIAAMGMFVTCWLLAERLYVVLWIENKLRGG